ncbi:MAG: HlyD family efflux transporter periplasmic adaptor subunit [Synechococcus sp. BS307-5m-G37]|nr:HlyD family efflux transporter periplasmic adaptor subunit [Synechococcus sp. BS307-5m-G37]
MTDQQQKPSNLSKLPNKANLSSLVVRPLDPQEVRLKPAPVWSRALAWTIIGTASFGFGFAIFSKIDEVVLATGELQPLGAERPIKAPFAGVVNQILVREGQKVTAGQALLRLDPQVSEKRAETLQTQLKLEKKRFEEETRSIQAREASLRERTEGLNRALSTENQIYTNISPLAAQGAIQGTELLRQRNRVEQLESEVAQSRANLQEVQAQLLKMKQESLREIADLERQLVEVEDTRNKEVLTAPVNGVVFGLVPSSPGYAASSGETLVKVVPGGTLEAKVFVTNRDVGFLEKGMPAQVRVDAFPYTQFGSIPGTLKSVGTLPVEPDAQNPQPRFPAYISLEREYLSKGLDQFSVSAGQSVQANLVLRDKRVISLLTDAVQKALDSLRSIRSKS